MEKARKDLKGKIEKSFKKKSKALLAPAHCLRNKEALEETKESWGSKSQMRRSTSGKKNAKEMIVKVGSLSNIHGKMNNLNSRYFTEAFSNKTQIVKEPSLKKLAKSNWISPERATVNEGQTRSTKDRLSLNSTAKPKNPEALAKGNENKSTMCEEISFSELQGARKDIQTLVKKTCNKEAISKKEFLKITDQYQKLINRIVFSQVVNQSDKKQYFGHTFSTDSQPQESGTFRVKAKEQCPGLQLQGLRKQGIDDYHDEFMSHYNQLSESWKRDLAEQRRY